MEWKEELYELLEATKRMASRDVAPGPDGIPGRVWAESINILAIGEIGSAKETGSPLGLTGGAQTGVPSGRGGQTS